jgi:hypothetical protein
MKMSWRSYSDDREIRLVRNHSSRSPETRNSNESAFIVAPSRIPHMSAPRNLHCENDRNNGETNSLKR